MACKILLLTSMGWPSVARIAGGFVAASCTVDAMSPDGTAVTVSRYVDRVHPYKALRPTASVADAIAGSKPDLVVPCDDRAVQHLLKYYGQLCKGAGAGSPEAEMIRRSLGKPESFAQMVSRDGFIKTARALGIRAPETVPIANEEELDVRLEHLGLPAVLKADGSWGGEGVVVVRSREEAHAAFRRLANPPSRIRSLARALRRRDAHYLAAALTPARQTVSLQRFVPGRPSACAFACWNGDVVAAFYYDVLVAEGGIGPPNVIRRVDCPEMEEATRKIARWFGISGIHGMDFIRDAAGATHLIEINPRSTQGGTLPFGKRRDLPAALAACLAPTAGAREAIANDVVVFFPREWRRDPRSPWLTAAFHDVPWDDPDVMLAALGIATRKRKARSHADPIEKNAPSTGMPRVAGAPNAA